MLSTIVIAVSIQILVILLAAASFIICDRIISKKKGESELLTLSFGYHINRKG